MWKVTYRSPYSDYKMSTLSPGASRVEAERHVTLAFPNVIVIDVERKG